MAKFHHCKSPFPVRMDDAECELSDLHRQDDWHFVDTGSHLVAWKVKKNGTLSTRSDVVDSKGGETA